MQYKTVIEKSREAIAYKLDIDMKKVYEAMQLLLDCLKPRYANSFYYSENKIKTFIEINNDLNIIRLRADHLHFFGNDDVYIFGVTVNYKDGEYEYTYNNMVNKIPIAFNMTKADNDIYKLRKMIDDINSSIEVELRKILNKDDKYIDCINKETIALQAENDFNKSFNEKLSKSNIVKKTAKKIKEFYKYTPLKIIAQNISVGYSDAKIGIVAQIEPYVYDRCVHLEFTRDTIYLGELILSYDGKHKFKPAFKNSKYFTSEITSLKYMRSTFKKHLIAEVE